MAERDGRRGDSPELSQRGFAGRWRAPRSDGEVTWLLDGCVSEAFCSDGSSWLSALSLRAETDRLEIGPGLSTHWRPLS